MRVPPASSRRRAAWRRETSLPDSSIAQDGSRPITRSPASSPASGVGSCHRGNSQASTSTVARARRSGELGPDTVVAATSAIADRFITRPVLSPNAPGPLASSFVVRETTRSGVCFHRVERRTLARRPRAVRSKPQRDEDATDDDDEENAARGDDPDQREREAATAGCAAPAAGPAGRRHPCRPVAVYEPVGETICKPFTGARVALPVPGVAVNVNVAAVRLRNTM